MNWNFNFPVKYSKSKLENDTKNARGKTTISDEVNGTDVVLAICLNKISMMPIPKKTISGYSQLLADIPASFFQGIEKTIAINAIMIPNALSPENVSENKIYEARTGINNESLCAMSVFTMPVYLTERARTRKRLGKKSPREMYTVLISGISGL